jgi:hypothetical protein
MPNIQVVFPATGNPILLHDAEMCPRGEVITWCFHSANSEIKSVEVVFDDAASSFFGNTSTPLSRRVPLTNGQADFYGHVPNYPVPLSSPKIAKYTVKAYDAVTGGNVVAAVDPVIITSQP